jgi:primary-amine oxidase
VPLPAFDTPQSAGLPTRSGATAPDSQTIVQTFPTGQAPETAWRVRWGYGSRTPGLYIRSAEFRVGQDAWIPVLGEAMLAEVFVPYSGALHPETAVNMRYWDLTTTEYGAALQPVPPQFRGPGGEAIDPQGRVIKQVRDRGIGWWYLGANAPAVSIRRGEELVLWAMVKVSYYGYIIQYSFHDDGTIAFRAGALGSNAPNVPYENHMHNLVWRVDVDLDGGERNSAMVMRHHETAALNGRATDSSSLFNGGLEGSDDWIPREFTMLRIVSNHMAQTRKERGYDVMPQRAGSARHFGSGEEFSLDDFWVTRSRKRLPPFVDSESSVKCLPDYANKESIANTDVVMWYTTSMHHEPRSEDGVEIPAPGVKSEDKVRGGYGIWFGATPVMWTGFDLRPRNIIGHTPFLPPSRR